MIPGQDDSPVSALHGADGGRSMVERVARAIQTSCLGALQPNDRTAARFARSAIEAMREPTEAMIEAYCRKHSDLGFTAWANASVILPAMIDAALSDPNQIRKAGRE